MSKPILCLDFDGVLHSYTSGWQGATIISDPPVEGAQKAVSEYLDHFDVWIVSTRSSTKEGRMAICDWLVKYAFPDDIMVSAVKPAAFVGLDDRVLTFDGTFPSVETLENFKPWNKR